MEVRIYSTGKGWRVEQVEVGVIHKTLYRTTSLAAARKAAMRFAAQLRVEAAGRWPVRLLVEEQF